MEAWLSDVYRHIASAGPGDSASLPRAVPMPPTLKQHGHSYASALRTDPRRFVVCDGENGAWEARLNEEGANGAGSVDPSALKDIQRAWLKDVFQFVHANGPCDNEQLGREVPLPKHLKPKYGYAALLKASGWFTFKSTSKREWEVSIKPKASAQQNREVAHSTQQQMPLGESTAFNANRTKAQESPMKRRRGSHGAAIDAKHFECTTGQALYEEMLQCTYDGIIVCLGPAGTGKTLFAVREAFRRLREGTVKKVVCIRPAVTAGDDLGHLPGDLNAKLQPFLAPIFDSCEHLGMTRDEVLAMISRGEIEPVHIGYVRGRTFHDSFVIADEMQNATMAQLKLLTTRPGKNTTMCLIGDPTQSDLAREADAADATCPLLAVAQRLETDLHDFLNRAESTSIARLKFPKMQCVFLNPSDVRRAPVVAQAELLFDELAKLGVS